MGEESHGIEFKLLTRTRERIPLRNIALEAIRFTIFSRITFPFSNQLSFYSVIRANLDDPFSIQNRTFSYAAIFYKLRLRISHYFHIISTINFYEENGTKSTKGRAIHGAGKQRGIYRLGKKMAGTLRLVQFVPYYWFPPFFFFLSLSFFP